MTLLSPLMPPLSSRGTVPVDLDQVYEAWNCDPRPNRLMSCVCSEWYFASPPWPQMVIEVLPKTP